MGIKKYFIYFLSTIAIQTLACDLNFNKDRVIYIGDSHSVQEFGQRLTKNMQESAQLENFDVERFAVAGSAAIHWNEANNTFLRALKSGSYCPGEGTTNGRPSANFPVFHQLVSGSTSQLHAVVIALGTNDIGWDCHLTASLQTAHIQKLLNEIPANTPCVWVGPPTIVKGSLISQCGVKNITTFVNNLKTTVSQRCSFVDSRRYRAPVGLETSHTSRWVTPNLADCHDPKNAVMVPNVFDGLDVHLSGDLADYWADCAALEVLKALE